ncbi:hypothetical protein AVEN_257924-1, partial [Araneus ventricosus]
HTLSAKKLSASAATKPGDLTDKTPSACKSNILSISISPSPAVHSEMRSPRPNPNEESGSVRGVRVLRRETNSFLLAGLESRRSFCGSGSLDSFRCGERHITNSVPVQCAANHSIAYLDGKR